MEAWTPDEWRALIEDCVTLNGGGASLNLASVEHLTHSYTDRCPLLLQLNPGLGRRLGERPFRFHAM